MQLPESASFQNIFEYDVKHPKKLRTERSLQLQHNQLTYAKHGKVHRNTFSEEILIQ